MRRRRLLLLQLLLIQLYCTGGGFIPICEGWGEWGPSEVGARLSAVVVTVFVPMMAVVAAAVTVIVVVG